jgi:hypothetical protein
MELQELVERIQRWKQRTSETAASPTPEFKEASEEDSEVAYAAEAMPPETDEVEKPGNGNLVDFDEMDVTELNNDDSGIIDVTES